MTLYLTGIVEIFILIFNNNNLELHISTHFSLNVVYTSPSLNHSVTSGSLTLQPRVAGGISKQITSTDHVLFIKQEKKIKRRKKLHKENHTYSFNQVTESNVKYRISEQ